MININGSAESESGNSLLLTDISNGYLTSKLSKHDKNNFMTSNNTSKVVHESVIPKIPVSMIDDSTSFSIDRFNIEEYGDTCIIGSDELISYKGSGKLKDIRYINLLGATVEVSASDISNIHAVIENSKIVTTDNSIILNAIDSEEIYTYQGVSNMNVLLCSGRNVIANSKNISFRDCVIGRLYNLYLTDTTLSETFYKKQLRNLSWTYGDSNTVITGYVQLICSGIAEYDGEQYPTFIALNVIRYEDR